MRWHQVYTSEQFYSQATFPAELKAKQADRYRAFFALFRNRKSAITGVTFWDIADDNTWHSEFAAAVRPDHVEARAWCSDSPPGSLPEPTRP
jgi:GH35 family endo-1,4-beta-xylanase